MFAKTCNAKVLYRPQSESLMYALGGISVHFTADTALQVFMDGFKWKTSLAKGVMTPVVRRIKTMHSPLTISAAISLLLS